MKTPLAAVLSAFALLASAACAQQVLPTDPIAPDTAPALAPSSAASSQPGSGARIIRLSQVIGEAQMERSHDRGYEAAFPNLPILQQAHLRTGGGVVEVEFEDGSSMRLAPGTEVAYPELRRTSTGSTYTAVDLLKGTVYVSLTDAARGNTFTLRNAGTEVTPEAGTHLRFAATTPDRRLAVFKGVAQVSDHGANLTVGKKSTLLFAASGEAPQLIATKGDSNEIDAWDKNSVDYHKRYNQASRFGTAGFGSSDLNYYGSFVDLPGCGNVWRPYFADAGWDPYGAGSWAYYSGAGYSWVSPYPWGWTPYHSGEWANCGGNGWGWRPGGTFNGIVNTPVMLRSAGGASINRPTVPPGVKHPSTILVTTRPVAISGATGGSTFTFRQGSAGLGVPRQTFGKLGGVSNGAARHGTVNASMDTIAIGGRLASPSASQTGGQLLPNALATHSGTIGVQPRAGVSASPMGGSTRSASPAGGPAHSINSAPVSSGTTMHSAPQASAPMSSQAPSGAANRR